MPDSTRPLEAVGVVGALLLGEPADDSVTVMGVCNTEAAGTSGFCCCSPVPLAPLSGTTTGDCSVLAAAAACVEDEGGGVGVGVDAEPECASV